MLYMRLPLRLRTLSPSLWNIVRNFINVESEKVQRQWAPLLHINDTNRHVMHHTPLLVTCLYSAKMAEIYSKEPHRRPTVKGPF